jgi:hypothetical protein
MNETLKILEKQLQTFFFVGKCKNISSPAEPFIQKFLTIIFLEEYIPLNAFFALKLVFD